MTKILVTGAGYVGSHLANKLADEGFGVATIDIKKPTNLDRKVKFVKSDLRNLSDLGNLSPEIIFHTAAVIDLKESIENPLKYYEVNVKGTVKLLEAARGAKVRRVVFSSSMSVYNINNPYSLTKFIGEEYMQVWANVYNLETVSLRYFNFYGPGSLSVVDKFRELSINKKPLLVSGSGKATRYFVHIDDLVKANIAAMTSKKVGRGETIDIAGKIGYRINDVAKMISDKIEKVPAEHRIDELSKIKPDLSKAKKLLGWEPKIKLEDYLRVARQ